MGEFLATVVMEALGRLFGDFLQRFQAVRDEAGIDDGDAPGAFLSQFLDRLVRDINN